MVGLFGLLRGVAALGGIIAVLGLGGCAHQPPVARAEEVESLTRALTTLAPTVSAREARQVAAEAFAYSRTLADEYRVVRPALLHNLLVNSGVKQRGLCFEWAEDLLAHLEKLRPATLELRWGIARAETVREHNCVVVTARGQSFAEGIVLDPWRNSGRLAWAPVVGDRYPWLEGELIPPAEAAVTP